MKPAAEVLRKVRPVARPWQRASIYAFEVYAFSAFIIYLPIVLAMRLIEFVVPSMLSGMGVAERGVIVQVLAGGVIFAFVLGIVASYGSHRVLILGGINRRNGATGVLIGGAAGVVVTVGVFTLLVWVESFIWPLFGKTMLVGDVAHGAGALGGLGTLLGTSLLNHALGYIAGAVIGSAYFKFGGWWGTLLLPFTLIPAFLALSTGLALSASSLEDEWMQNLPAIVRLPALAILRVESTAGGLFTHIIVQLLVAALGVGAVYWFWRTTNIRKPLA